MGSWQCYALFRYFPQVLSKCSIKDLSFEPPNACRGNDSTWRHPSFKKGCHEFSGYFDTSYAQILWKYIEETWLCLRNPKFNTLSKSKKHIPSLCMQRVWVEILWRGQVYWSGGLIFLTLGRGDFFNRCWGGGWLLSLHLLLGLSL